MPENVVTTCRIYDLAEQMSSSTSATGDSIDEERVISWNGPPDTLEAVGVPRQLTAGQSVTIRGLVLSGSDEPIRVRPETSDELRITWPEGRETPDGTVLWPDSRSTTNWDAWYQAQQVKLGVRET